MQHITVKRNTVNFDALNDDLRDALDEVVIGLSTRPGAVIVHLSDEATSEQLAEAQKIAISHDETVITTAQTVELAQSQSLYAARDANQEKIDADRVWRVNLRTFKQMINKIAWLEQEIRDLRGI